MKKLLTIVLLGVALFTFGLQRPALAGDATAGAKIFTANCNACHLNGGNVVNGAKTLKNDALIKYLDNYDEDGDTAAHEKAIAYQVTNGKGAMPKFGGRLQAKQIEDVSAYVASKAEGGW